jgi:hypothetical protein
MDDPYLKDERVLRIYEVGYGDSVRTKEAFELDERRRWRSKYSAAIDAFNKRLEQAEERESNYIKKFLLSAPETIKGGFTRRALDMQARGWPARSIWRLDYGVDFGTLIHERDQAWYASKIVGLTDNAEALYWAEQLGITALFVGLLEEKAKTVAHEAKVQAIIDASPPPGERKR